MSSNIKPCNCVVATKLHRQPGGVYVNGATLGSAGIKFQEEKYGVGMRVHTPSKDGPRCTCCGRVKR